MPIVKTEIAARTRANVAYAAALTELSETQIYGLLLDTFAGSVGPDKLVDLVNENRDKEVSKNASDSNDSE